MAPTKTTSDNAPVNADGGIVKRRNRIPVSCESCRNRKLKCDRQKPQCQNCKARDFATCNYASHDGFRAGAGAGAHPGGLDEMGDRLHRLEALVSSMAQSEVSPRASGAAGVPSSAISKPEGGSNDEGYPSVESAMDSSAPYGTMVSASSGNHYVGSSNWQAILTDIAAIKEQLEDNRGLPKLRPEDADQAAIFGGVLRYVSRGELLAALPARPLADLLIERFFGFYDPSMPYSHFIHRPSFTRHYERFWADQAAWPVAKLGMLFAMLCLALASYARNGDPPPDLAPHAPAMADGFRHRAAQCILASNLGAPTFDSVLALKMYGIAEYARLPYDSTQHRMIHSLLVQQALRLGFHRDPDGFPSIPPFEAEQRRRIWHSVCQLDMLLALQLGLPSTTRYEESNVAPPRSLYDGELYEGMLELPPSRPPTEPTPVAYMIAKQRIVQVMGRVVQHLNMVRVPSDDEVLDLNRDLATARDSYPPHLRHKPWEHSINDPQPLRLQRTQLAIFYDKAMCLLNRRFLAVPAHARARFARHRALCVQAALDLLTIQGDMHRLGVKWYAFALTRNDFLLATAILCRTMHIARTAPAEATNGPNAASLVAEELQIRDALGRARSLWEQLMDVSADARPACRMIGAMLDRVPANSAAGSLQTSVAPGAVPALSPVPSLVGSFGARAGSGSDGAAPPSSGQPTVSSHGSTPEDLQFSDMMDWSTWDSLVQGNDFGAGAFDDLDQLWAT